jgi:hypothetical protein
LLPPKQETLACDVVAEMAEGSVMENVLADVHPFASVIVQVYDPAGRLPAVAAVPPDGDHEYVYDGIPPVAETVALPLLPPLQEMLTCDVVTTMAVGSVIVVLAVALHPLSSVIVQVYVPGASEEAVAAVPPEGAHAYVNGDVPPEGAAVADPLSAPLQDTFVLELIEALTPAELFTTTVVVLLHPFESVTVQVYVPAESPVAAAAVPPDGAHE